MITVIDSSRAEMLCEVRAKREMALRCARTGDAREQEYWLRVAGQMTEWIGHLETGGDADIGPGLASAAGESPTR